MNRQLAAVLWTYPQRFHSGVVPVILFLVSAVGIWRVSTLKIDPSLWFVMYVVGLLAINLKQQVNHARERSLPDGVVWHVGVGMGLLALMLLGPLLIGMACRGQWHWGFPGLILALAAIAFAGVMCQSMWISLLAVPVIWFMMSPDANQWFNNLSAGNLEGSGMLLFASGVVGIVGSLIWMLRLTEEDRAYHIRVGAKAGDLYRRDLVDTAQSDAARQIWRNRWFSRLDPLEKTMASWPNWARGSLWNRVRLWNQCRNISPLYWIFIFVFPLSTLKPQWLSSHKIGPIQPPSLMYVFIFPIIMVIGVWVQQRANMSMELLRPVNRSQFFLEIGLTMARQLITLWFLLTASWIAAIAIILPDTLQGISIWRWLVSSLVMQAMMFSLGIWLMRYRSPMIWLAAFFVGTMVVSISAATVIKSGITLSDGSLIVGAIFLISISALVGWDAYRRWLNTELG